MVILSKLVCVHTYNLSSGPVSIVPGRNAFGDDIGRELFGLKSFQEAIKHAQPGTLTVEIPPAPSPEEEKAAAGAKGKPGPKPKAEPEEEKAPETAVSALKLADAIKLIRTLTVVDQISTIQISDPREEVKEACQKRLDKLAEEAETEASKKKD